jgi:catechol 2,3-dioxygenase-like lactoylglutathione lyase family enzyme
MSMPRFPDRNPRSPLSSMTADHVAIRVPDLDVAIRWFIDKLDFRVIHRWPYGELRLAYVAPADDDGFLVELIGGATPVAQPVYPDLAASLPEPGFHHLCLRVASIDDAFAELRRRGVTVVAEPFDLADISRRLAFVADPWGNLIELAQVLA